MNFYFLQPYIKTGNITYDDTQWDYIDNIPFTEPLWGIVVNK